MNFYKILLFTVALTGGVAGGIIYYDPVGRYRRKKFLDLAEEKAAEIDKKKVEDKTFLKTMRKSRKDKEWELMYWNKIWWDGWDRRTQDDYKNYDKEIWEKKFWERYTTGKVTISNMTGKEIEGIYKEKRYPKGWEKYREMCRIWYVVGEGYVKDVNSEHVCLHTEDTYPKTAWEEIEKQPKGDVSEILWANKKRLNNVGTLT